MKFRNKWVELGVMAVLIAVDVALLILLIYLMKRMGMEVYI